MRFIRALNYFIFMHPRFDVRFSASFLEKEEKSSLIAKYFLFYDFSWKYLCKTWWYHENFRNQRKCFQNIHLSIMTKNSLSKDIHMSTIGVKTQFVFNWCQATIGFQRGHWLRGSKISQKFHGSSNVSLWRWSKYGYVSLNEFFMSFSINSKSFKTHIFRHITIPLMNWGGARKLFKISEKIKPDHISLPKCFLTYLNQLRSKISKGLIFLIRGENVI